MIDNNLISSKSVIAKVIADLDLREEDIRISDIREWIGESMEHIGAITQLDHKTAVIEIKGYQAKLPCDLYRLDQVGFSFNCNHGWLPMRRTTNSFSVFKEIPDCCEDGCCGSCQCCKHCDDDECNATKCDNMMHIHDEEIFPIVKNLYNLTNDKDALDILNKDQNVRQTIGALVNRYTSPVVNRGGNCYHWGMHGPGCNHRFKLQYDTKPGYIKVNVPKGYLKISYYAMYTDEDSMPLIPNLASYKEAIYWYVAQKLMYPKYLRGELNQNIYYGMKQSWAFFKNQAYGEAMMPTVDALESIKNDWHKLYPEFDMHDEFFESQGDEQILYNQNNY